MPYAQTTFGQLANTLSIRLGDTSTKFWTPLEIRAYLREALRAWQAFSGNYYFSDQFSTSPNISLYDIRSLQGLAPTITDRDLITEIEMHLQEPLNSSAWSGTEQFTFEQIVEALQKRLNLFLQETGVVQDIITIPGPVPPSNTIQLPQNVMDIRRAIWRDSEGVEYLLWPEDPLTLNTMSIGWTLNPGIPSGFIKSNLPPLILRLTPAPLNTGEISMLLASSGPTLAPELAATILGIPDDLAWIIKYGALADILTADGPGQDVNRAQYFETRWADGLKIARVYNNIRSVRVNGVPVILDSIYNLDTSNPTWISSLPGIPKLVGVSGNIVAVSPVPDSDTHSIGLDLVPHFPVPQIDSSFVEVGQESLDGILNYAQHVAYFKEGINEINSSIGLLQNFVNNAIVVNDRLRAASVNFSVLAKKGLNETKYRPRRQTDTQLGESNV